jgi:hypothetical protein
LTAVIAISRSTVVKEKDRFALSNLLVRSFLQLLGIHV